MKAWDGDWLIGSRDVTIRVANADDEGTVTLSHIQPESGTKITATLTDPDGISQTVDWTWETAVDTAAEGTVVNARVNATTLTSTYTPTAGDGTNNSTLSVRAEYTDSDGTRYIDSDDPARVADDKDPPSTTSTAVRSAPADSNQAPKFYKNGVNQDPPETPDEDDTNERLPKNEATTYTRYVLENTIRNVALSEVDARVYDTSPDTPFVSGTDDPVDGVVTVYDTWDNTLETPPVASVEADGTGGNQFLHYSLSGADAKYFEIPQADVTAVPDDGILPKTRGVIRTKGPLDFETRRSYTVTVTATDPGGLTDTVTVTIHVVDVPEIEQVESRQWVPENTKEIMGLNTSLRGDVSKGGWKWSLLTGPDTGSAPPVVDPVSTPPHNRTSDESIDCVYDDNNDGLCDNFRFSNFNGANTQLLFAIGSGADHKAPDFEKPSDRGTTTAATDPDLKDNVYKIVVRVAFANLRSQEGDPIPINHPNPQSDERQDFPVWIRVTDVDEDPSFTDDASTRLITENSDDDLPAIGINRSVPATVAATDPEYGYADGSQYQKKLVYSLDAGDYSNLFQIVPSTGEILTRSRLNYESLTEVDEMGPDGGQHRVITGPTVTATDTASNSDDLGANIRVNDVNETPIPAEDLAISGDAAVSDYAENQEDTTVGTYMVSGDNAASDNTWSLGGADMSQFTLAMVEDSDLSRMLKFKAAPNFEMPRGQAMSDTNTNTYMVTIQAMHDADDTTTMDVAITVTNAEEPGTVTLDPANPSVGTEITATVADDDIVSTVSWQWASADAMDGNFENIDGADSETYTPVAADAGMYLQATATYTDGFDSGNTAMAVSASDVTELAVNGDSAVDHPENVATVGTYTASASSVTWSVSGDDDGQFSISSSGVLSFDTAPDFENPADTGSDNVYNVTVEANDGNTTANLDVIITVTDVSDERPMAVQDYDTNEDGIISILEALEAVDDHFAGLITVREALEVIDAHFAAVNGG